ncbi:phage protein NinX family protein [Pseudomonas sp. LS.1a]|uniref:phage protein NinX family protein n=1 Tax=Pseudomonas sp. LS.1a TaxID=2920387 RepID=UPI001F13AA9F|nr:phage protein NinX family protein [Pseudomonas sp. LS.1a]UMY59858.1 DUF2591 domain-containing protein [Pseudomonas sp. LS.1a]
MTDLIEVRVSNLVGAPLDWAVAMAEGFESDPERLTNVWLNEEDPTSISIRGVEMGYGFRPSSNWEHGGPLIEKHQAGLSHDRYLSGGPCGCSAGPLNSTWLSGPTPLIAFCRALVHAKLGPVVRVPKELISCPA